MSDEQLMQQVVKGDMEALGALFERHKKPLFSFLARFLQDQTLAEDVLVDVFFRLYDRRRTYRADCKFTTWLYTIAHNLAIDQLKHLSAREKVLEKLVIDTPTVEEDQGFETLARAEDSQKILEAVNKLPDDQRAVIILRVYQELSYREISEVTGLVEETVRVRAHRARQSLKKLLVEVIAD